MPRKEHHVPKKDQTPDPYPDMPDDIESMPPVDKYPDVSTVDPPAPNTEGES